MVFKSRFWFTALYLGACASLCVATAANGEELATPRQMEAEDSSRETTGSDDSPQPGDEIQLRYAQNNQEEQNTQMASSDSEGWSWTLSPYVWFLGLDGDVTVQGETSEVDVSFSDLWDNLDVALMLHLELQKNKWSIFVDPMYASLGVEGGLGPIDIDVDVQMWIIEAGVGYRLIDRPIGSSGRFHMKAGPLLGFRWTSMDVDIDAPFFLPFSDAGGSTDWLDLIVGWRNEIRLGERWQLNTRLDIGGFDIGTSSDFTWNSQILFGFKMTENSILHFGYRTLDSDYDRGSGDKRFEWDVETSGPVLGASIKF